MKSFTIPIHRTAGFVLKGLLLLLTVFFAGHHSMGQLKVLQPNDPGIVMVSNRNYTAVWQRAGTSFSRVKIKLSVDGGVTFPYLLQTNTPSNATDSSEAFRIPGIPTTMGRIRITDQNDSTIGDISDNNFTITGYCWPWGAVCTNNNITNFTLNTTLNNTTTCAPPAFTSYPKAGSFTTTMQRGLSYSFSIKTNNANSGVGIWIDRNDDFDFDDADEALYLSTTKSNTHTGTITIPNSCGTGDKRIRVRSLNDRLLTSGDACTQYNIHGETEDYIVAITQPTITVAGSVLTNCAGATISVNFSRTGTFLPDNVFQVQLSDPGGNFGTYTTVLATGSSSPISTYIRLGTLSGTYRIRIASSSPVVFGTPSNYFTVRDKPDGPVTTSAARCGPGSLSLSASGCASTRWYAAPEGGTHIATGSNYNTPSLSASTTYYVACVDGNFCQSLRKPVIAEIRELPTITSFTPALATVDFDDIQIVGTGFSSLDSVVFFKDKKATHVENILATSLTTRAPMGAIAGPIKIYNQCGSVESGAIFTPIVPTIEDPEFDTEGGTYPGAIAVEIYTSTIGADIYYSLDGVKPIVGAANTRKYTGPVFVGKTLTLKAIAHRTGWIESGISTVDYTITTPTKVATPDITPPTGSYVGGQLVTITCATPGSSIYFTTNGQTPNPGVKYIGPFTRIDPFVQVKSIGRADGYADSPVKVSNLTISGGTALSSCSFSPPPGIYGSAQNVTISNPDPLATIYYTIDGTDPYQHNPLALVYTGPVNINTTATLKAQAFRAGYGDSPRTTGIYTIGALRLATSGDAPQRQYFTESVGVYGYNLEEESSYSVFAEAMNKSTNQSVKVYPNPTTGTLFIDYGAETEHVTISIINMMGQVVRSVETHEASFGAALSIANQPTGFYIVRIEDKNGVKAEKRVVLK